MLRQKRYIAAGPALIKPVANMGKTTLRVIQVLSLVGLPLLVLAAGVVVMVVRRR